MSGSSVAAPDAAPWITDFLNAAYFRRTPELRDVDDLRLAFAIVTTHWHRAGHRRLRIGGRARLPPRVRPRALPGRLARPARDAQPRAAAGGRVRPARGLVPGRLRGRRAARLGDRLRGRARQGGLPPGGAPAQGAARGADARHGAAGGADLAHLPAGGHALRRGRRGRAHQAGDLAGLRVGDRPLHARAHRRARGPDVRDRGGGGDGARPARSTCAAT